jgi:hypothetical protein
VPARCAATIAATVSVTRVSDRKAEAAEMGSAGAARHVLRMGTYNDGSKQAMCHCVHRLRKIKPWR